MQMYIFFHPAQEIFKGRHKWNGQKEPVNSPLSHIITSLNIYSATEDKSENFLNGGKVRRLVFMSI